MIFHQRQMRPVRLCIVDAQHQYIELEWANLQGAKTIG